MNKVEKILEDANKYSNKSLEENIKSRLQKTFDRYMEELSQSSERLKSKKLSTVFKELNK